MVFELLEQLPIALILALVGGLEIYLAKDWSSFHPDNVPKSTFIFRESIFFGFLLFVGSFILLFLNILLFGTFNAEILKNLPINAGVLSLTLGTSILIVRGGINYLNQKSNFILEICGDILDGIYRNPLLVFLLTFIFCLIIKYSGANISLKNVVVWLFAIILTFPICHEVFKGSRKEIVFQNYLHFVSLLSLLLVIFAIVFDKSV